MKTVSLLSVLVDIHLLSAFQRILGCNKKPSCQLTYSSVAPMLRSVQAATAEPHNIPHPIPSNTYIHLWSIGNGRISFKLVLMSFMRVNDSTRDIKL